MALLHQVLPNLLGQNKCVTIGRRLLSYGGFDEGYHSANGLNAARGETIVNPHHKDSLCVADLRF